MENAVDVTKLSEDQKKLLDEMQAKVTKNNSIKIAEFLNKHSKATKSCFGPCTAPLQMMMGQFVAEFQKECVGHGLDPYDLTDEMFRLMIEMNDDARKTMQSMKAFMGDEKVGMC